MYRIHEMTLLLLMFQSYGWIVVQTKHTALYTNPGKHTGLHILSAQHIYATYVAPTKRTQHKCALQHTAIDGGRASGDAFVDVYNKACAC
jgi:hypothetical protein